MNVLEWRLGPRQLQKAGRKADSPTEPVRVGVYPARRLLGPSACLSIQYHLRKRPISLNVGNSSKICLVESMCGAAKFTTGISFRN